MANLILEAPMEEYEKAGFLIKRNRKYVTIVALEKPTPRSYLPKHGESYQIKDELFISLSLNIGVWGPKGSLVIYPDEDGLVFHPPTKPSTQTITFDPQQRVIYRHGLWLITVFYAINEHSTSITEAQLEDVFRISEEGDALVIERKIEHKLYPYRWPYIVKCYPDGSLQIALKRPLLPIRVLKRLKCMF
jgi:hypothetical protein